jgi:glycosyltransferase involved in cell wall biosynthesis
VLELDAPRGPAPLHDLRICRRLTDFCRREQVDLLHSHSSKAGALAAVIGAQAAIPSVYTPHAWSFQRELSPLARSIYVEVERLLARRHAHVILVSDCERTVAERHRVAPTSRLELIHTGLTDERLPSRSVARRELGLDSEEFVIGWVGRTGPQKWPEQLPELARRLTGEATIVALGDGIPDSESGRELERLGGRAVRAVDPRTVYAASDAFALTSRWEGSPLVVLEAMRASLPVVSYDVGGVRELMTSGVTGCLAELGDIDGLAAQLRRLAQNPFESRRMGLAGRSRFCSRFRLSDMVGSIDASYQRVLTSMDSWRVAA